MSQLEALSLKDSTLPKVNVHATVVLSILSSYMRRSPRDSRIIGTLLGEKKEDGSITVSECFAVPFSEKPDELYVSINLDYHKLMYAFHRRNNKKEVIVGWYTTTTQNGQYVVDNSSLVNDFYSIECENPINLVVDTTLSSDKVGIRGFMCQPTVVGDDVLAKAFKELTVDVAMTDAEATCLYQLINCQTSATASETTNSGDSTIVASATSSAAPKWASSSILSTAPKATDKVESSIRSLQTVLDDIQSYVDGVVEGKIPASRDIGIAIAEALNAFSATSAQLTQQQQQQQQAPLNCRVQDLLMVSHLTTLTQAQTLISEKLSQIL